MSDNSDSLSEGLVCRVAGVESLYKTINILGMEERPRVTDCTKWPFAPFGLVDPTYFVKASLL